MRFLGKRSDNQTIYDIQEQYYDNYYNYTNDDERQAFGFTIDDFHLSKKNPQLEVISIEQLLSMPIKHIHDLATLQGGKKILDAVVTVPPYADFRYRQQLKDAITLSGLNSLAFIHENTAAALFYGLDRLDNETKHTAMFLNLGSSSLKASLVEYIAIENNNTLTMEKNPQIETVNVLAEAWDESVNGYQFTIRLSEIIAEKFDEIRGDDGPSFKESARRMYTIIAKAEKFK